jgi:long-subunit fatty acid transport protein
LAKLRIPILAVLAALMMAGPSPATQVFFYDGTYQPDYGLDLNWLGSSARARAMGGAFSSIADDASAVTWNPAGLIQSLDPQISFSGVYVNPKSVFELDNRGVGAERFAYDNNVWRIDYASFLAPITIREHEFSLSAAYQRLNQMSSARSQGLMYSPLIFMVDFIEGNENILTSFYEQSAEGGIDVANLAFGTSVYENLAFGASANIYFGSADETTDFFYEETGTYHNVLWGTYEGKIRWRGHILSEVSYSGFNVTVGLHYSTERFKAALVGKTPFSLVRQFDVTVADTGFFAQIDGVYRPSEQQPEFIVGDRKEKIDIPVTLVAGISYSLSPNFLVSADVEWRRFGKSDISVLDSGVIRSSGEKEEYFTATPLNFQNSGEARIGLEYLLQGIDGIVPIRAGFRYVQHYLRDIDTLFMLPNWDINRMLYVYQYESAGDRITGYGLSAGTGIHWETIWLDVAVEYYTDSRSIGYLDIDRFDEESSRYILSVRNGEDNFKQTRITVNFTGFF